MPPRSKIAQLPEDVRSWLHRALVERAFGDIEAVTAELNSMLAKRGSDITVGKSAVGEASLKLKRAQEALRASVEAARMLQQDIGSGDALGGAALDMVQSEVFQISMRLQEAQDMKDEDRIALIKDLSLATSRLSRARVNQDRWAADVRAKAEAAAKQVQDMATKGGMSDRTTKRMYNLIMGIADER